VKGRVLLLAILVYVGLDLCLPDMPGAFVFEPSQSVETIDRARGRLTTEIVVLRAPVPASMPLMPPHPDLRHRLPPLSKVAFLGHPVVSCLPRAHCGPARSSEDPH
jgi:hypothetical protein